VAEKLAEELELPLPEMPWHAERDRVAAIASALGVTAGAMAKIAGDIVLLAQTEVGEVSEEEAPGKGGSSAMPQKRNPVNATLALASSRLALGQVPIILSAMQQEHERGAGGWQAEWAALPALFCYTSGAVEHVSKAVQGLQVQERRMRENLEQAGGLLMSEALMMRLAASVGRQEAQRLVQAAGERALNDGRSLRSAVLDDAHICAYVSPEAVEQALDPAGYLGSTDLLIDRALASYRAIGSEKA
jgi:3-carboxy-cis,cis-muconate cycloisomerase